MHHDTHQYRTSFLYKLHEQKWAKYVDYVKFRSGIGVSIFICGILLLIAGSFVSMKVLASSYIVVLLVLVPPIITSWLSRKELFLQLDANIVDNRVYSRGLNKWILWAATYFVNLMAVGGACLLLFSITCITLADDEPTEQTVYIEKIDIDRKTNSKIADVVFEDGVQTKIFHVHHNHKEWRVDTKQTILVRKTILGIRVLAE